MSTLKSATTLSHSEIKLVAYLDNEFIVLCPKLQQFPRSLLVVKITMKVSQKYCYLKK